MRHLSRRVVAAAAPSRVTLSRRRALVHDVDAVRAAGCRPRTPARRATPRAKRDGAPAFTLRRAARPVEHRLEPVLERRHVERSSALRKPATTANAARTTSGTVIGQGDSCGTGPSSGPCARDAWSRGRGRAIVPCSGVSCQLLHDLPARELAVERQEVARGTCRTPSSSRRGCRPSRASGRATRRHPNARTPLVRRRGVDVRRRRRGRGSRPWRRSRE